MSSHVSGSAGLQIGSAPWHSSMVRSRVDRVEVRRSGPPTGCRCRTARPRRCADPPGGSGLLKPKNVKGTASTTSVTPAPSEYPPSTIRVLGQCCCRALHVLAHVVGADVDLVVGGVTHRVEVDVLLGLLPQRADEGVADRAGARWFQPAACEDHLDVGARRGRCRREAARGDRGNDQQGTSGEGDGDGGDDGPARVVKVH